MRLLEADGTHDETTLGILAEAPFLVRLARRLTPRTSDADDLVQETLFRAWKARDRFIRGTSLRAWLATILRRQFLTAAIRDRRRGTLTDTDCGEPLSLAGGRRADLSELPYEKVLERVDDRVRDAFGRLPAIFREPFVLFVLEGLSYAEIAQRLGVPAGTVMSRIHRARGRLRRTLGDAGIGAG